MEGWVLSYRDTATGTPRVFVNKGRMDKYDVTQVHANAIMSSGVAMASWVGRNGGIEMRQVVSFGERDVVIYFHHTLINTGTTTQFDVKFLRNIDPDQEQPWSAVYAHFVTNNYVKFQYQATALQGMVVVPARVNARRSLTSVHPVAVQLARSTVHT
jgi:hypothetical protein